MPATFEGWVGSRRLSGLGTNAGADALAFQNWQHFKESFAPELVARAVRESTSPVRRCLDPFSGSGTTALACQFLGIKPIAIEVNPYLADLIEAKLTTYDIGSLPGDARLAIEYARDVEVDATSRLNSGPSTLIEPGLNNRWVFDQDVANRVVSLLDGIERLSDERNRRLFKVLVGGQLVQLSNVRISGKGRRYRGGWQKRRVSPDRVLSAFVDSLSTAVHDITLHRNRACKDYELQCGDAREHINTLDPVDLAVFSPPYPNSFDYTDVYNLELWMLGYLQNAAHNATLRASTISSHVQLQRPYEKAPECSELALVLEQLKRKRDELWHPDIPDMIGGYFD